MEDREKWECSAVGIKREIFPYNSEECSHCLYVVRESSDTADFIEFTQWWEMSGDRKCLNSIAFMSASGMFFLCMGVVDQWEKFIIENTMCGEDGM